MFLDERVELDIKNQGNLLVAALNALIGIAVRRERKRVFVTAGARRSAIFEPAASRRYGAGDAAPVARQASRHP